MEAVDTVDTVMASFPLAGLFAGRVQAMPGDGRPTGIFKVAVGERVRLGFEGLECDAQADRRVHGGPEKALHQFAQPSYARLAQRFPDRAAGFVPGSIGENLSVAELDETRVCIGDVFALGTARIQLNQPRRPCWKIDARYGEEGISAFIANQGLAGWYFRVLEPGVVGPDDALGLIDRAPRTLSLDAFHRLFAAHRPAVEALLQAADLPGLASGWSERLRARAAWLREHGGGDGG